MNKTYAGIVFAALMAIGLIGYVTLVAIGRDVTEFSTTLLNLLGLASVALGLQAGLSRIERQTNGTLSTLQASNAALRTENAQLREHFAAATGTAGIVPTPTDPAAPAAGAPPTWGSPPTPGPSTGTVAPIL